MTTPLPSNKHGPFQHAPLDHTQPSIRLIEIGPGFTAIGIIQCKVSHTTIEATYTCLSYRWGPNRVSTSKMILMNGKPFFVRQNLYDFLHFICSERQTPTTTQRRYWIDALCIDQSNTSERNHQVAQMGRIFSSAWRVHVWLGKTSNAQRMLELLQSRRPLDYAQHDPIKRRTRVLIVDSRLIMRHILYNKYWDRAWIVQEITLAKEVVVTLDWTTLSLFEFIEQVHRLSIDVTQSPFGQFDVVNHRNRLESLRGQSLLTLLAWFRKKDCVIPQDRIFSLLALCHPKERLDVDYERPWTDVVIEVLKRATHEPCICSAALLAKSLTPSPSSELTGCASAEPMLAFDITDVYVAGENAVNMLLRRGRNTKKHLRSHRLGHRACLWGLLETLRTKIRLDANRMFYSGSSTSNDARVSVAQSFRGSLRTNRSLNGETSVEFERVSKTLLWYKLVPGWYLSARDAEPKNVTVHVSLRALGEVSDNMDLCGWQGERGNVTGDDLLFRHFKIHHPPRDQEVGLV